MLDLGQVDDVLSGSGWAGEEGARYQMKSGRGEWIEVSTALLLNWDNRWRKEASFD